MDQRLEVLVAGCHRTLRRIDSKRAQAHEHICPMNKLVAGRIMSPEDRNMKDTSFSLGFEDVVSGETNWNHLEKEEILSPRSTCKSLEEFRSIEVFQAALVEFITSASFVFMSLGLVIACMQSDLSSKLAIIAIVDGLLVAAFISAAIPSSGGHFNPCLTVAHVLMGHSSVGRGVLYVACQSLGAIVGALAVKSIVDPVIATKYALGGCILNQTISIDGDLVLSGVTFQQGFISELAFSFIFIYIAFSTGLDPKRAPTWGPIVGPIFCGMFVAMTIFISGGLTPGYSGAGFNPAKCLGSAVAMGHQVPILWEDYWVFLIAPLCASSLMALVYHLILSEHTSSTCMRGIISPSRRGGFKGCT